MNSTIQGRAPTRSIRPLPTRAPARSHRTDASPLAAATPLPLPLPQADDLSRWLDLAFSTHLTVVVRAELDSGNGQAPVPVNLVLPRTALHDPQRLVRALLDAAQSAVGRLGQAGDALPCSTHTLTSRIAGERFVLGAWVPAFTTPCP